MAKQWKGIAADFIKAMKAQFIGQGAEANDIFVQDLYTYNTPDTRGTGLKSKANALDEFKSMSAEERSIYSALLAVYNEHITNKREILTQSRNLFDTSDIIWTLVDVMIDDGFNSFQNENEEFKIEYILEDEDLENLGEEYQQQVQNIIDEFIDKFSIKQKAADIIPDIIRDGEYAFGVLFDPKGKKGIVEIIDDFDVINLMPFYEGDKLAFVIDQKVFEDTGSKSSLIGKYEINSNNSPEVYKPDNMIFFRLNNRKKRINMSAFYNEDFRELFHKKTHIKLPKYIRTSVPLYYGAMKILNRIKIMENVSTVLDLSDVLKPEIVHVSVPTNTDATQAQQIIRDYERQLNDNSSLDADDCMEFSSLAAQANRRKVLPVWMDTKGTLSSAGINQGTKGQGAWDSIERLRNLAALNIGIPPFYLNISGAPIDKAQIIKLYSRYTRKLTALQRCLADGIKDLLMAHLTHCGVNISRDNLSIKFKAITSGDSLDDTDMLVGLVAGINDLYKALDEITSSENNNLVLDDEQFKELFDDLTGKYLNISNLIKIDENKFENLEGEDGSGFEPIGSPGDHSAEPITGPAGPSMTVSSGTEDTSYQDFVADSNDIGVEGTEPAIEEI